MLSFRCPHLPHFMRNVPSIHSGDTMDFRVHWRSELHTSQPNDVSPFGGGEVSVRPSACTRFQV